MAFAPRPHVELVHVLDMPAREVLFPGANKPARLIVLSESPVNKAVSAVLDLPPGWERERGVNNDTFVEYYLLAGDLLVGGDLQLLPHHYFRTEKGAAAGPWSTVHGARVLYFTEGDPMNWQATPQPAPTLSEGIVWNDTNLVGWEDTFVPGPNVVAETGARLKIKMLYRDPETGAYSRLILAEAGWHDHRYAHHPVVEEAFTIRGHMTYNFGTLEVDTYFYRPPRIKHGNFEAYPDGTVWLIRSDGDLENIYTSLDGEPGNWAYGTDREPVLTDAENLVRSKRAGPWSGEGQHIVKT
ncbi:MAG: DUF4437 domain-containing protein [Dehalococcoidia bacterium]|nr:DUF4437 domain-containing protein [Dehalococcoidia bacterium]